MPAEASLRAPPADRATVPAVGKALEAGVVVLYVGLLTTALFGGYVADYRTAAGDELGERTLATASHRIRAAVPPNATVARAHVRVDLPDTIRGKGYRIRTEGRSLVLDHPAAGVGGRTRLALPERVAVVSGTWHSRMAAAVRVERVDGGVAVRLVSGRAAERGLPDRDGPGDGDDGDRCRGDDPGRGPDDPGRDPGDPGRGPDDPGRCDDGPRRPSTGAWNDGDRSDDRRSAGGDGR